MSGLFRFSGKPGKHSYYVMGLCVAAMWVVLLVNQLLPLDLNRWGLQPRSLSGLIGIPLSPFLHASFEHLAGNTLPLLLLLFLLVSSREDSVLIVLVLVALSGSLLWVIGRPAIHIGASGLIFGLCSFLMTVGIRERRIISATIAILVTVLYGGTMLAGIIPHWQSGVSWDGHLGGLLSGVLAGFVFSRSRGA